MTSFISGTTRNQLKALEVSLQRLFLLLRMLPRPAYSKELGTVLCAHASLRWAGTSGDYLVQPFCSKQGQTAQDHVQLVFWKLSMTKTQQCFPVTTHSFFFLLSYFVLCFLFFLLVCFACEIEILYMEKRVTTA